MNRLSFSFLLICTAISHLSTPVSSQSDAVQGHYPPGWQDSPGSVGEFPVGEIDGQKKTIIDPWVYLQRMGIFKLMVQNTKPYFNSWGYNNTGNLLWGLPLQFGWQKSSGRLRNMVDSLDCGSCVSPNSWWADMNYFLSVLPFLGALNAGVFSPLKYPVYIAKPANVDENVKQKFCTSVQECLKNHGDVIRDWTEFFERVKVASSRSDQDATVALMWKAHTTSLLNGESDKLHFDSTPFNIAEFGKLVKRVWISCWIPCCATLNVGGWRWTKFDCHQAFQIQSCIQQCWMILNHPT